MYRLIYLILLIILFNCSLTEPSTLIIENSSQYTINLSISSGDKKKITLSKNKGENVLVLPGEIKIEVNIESIKFNKEYSIKVDYLEKKKFIFNINK